jgi:hypothetical protein
MAAISSVDADIDQFAEDLPVVVGIVLAVV